MKRIFELSTPLPDPPQTVFEWHARPGAFRRLVPPWKRVALRGGDPVIEDGSQVEIEMRQGPLKLRWLAEHREVRPGLGFQDVQLEGPFARWLHSHDFAPRDEGSILTDRVEYRLPGGRIADLVAGRPVRRDLERMFAYRHATTRADLALHRRYRDRPRLAVAMTGASGLIGGALSALLETGGHQVLPLSRGDHEDRLGWDPATGLARPAAFPAVDALVHLAAENIAGGRWNRAHKERIRASRVDATARLVESLERLESRPSTLVCASAVGIYGHRPDERLDEAGAPGEGFLADVGREWERAARAAESLGIRVVLLRFGVVVTPAGGFLARLLPPFRAGLGGVVGSGRQIVSWVSIDDAVGAALHCLMDERITGPVNVTAPSRPSNRQLTRVLGRTLRRPTLVPLPAFAARAAFGQMADELLLASVDAQPSRLLASGFAFRHPDFATAARRLLGL